MLDFNEHAHVYQKNAAGHLWNSSAVGGVAALWLDPGYGKTMIVLHAFKALLEAGLVETMLIVAPLRVCQTVWAQEIENWASLKGLVAQRLHGPKKERWLERKGVNIWIVNYEGIPWATKMAKMGKMPKPDVVCFDEVRRMKNAQGKRFKQARPLVAMAKYRWGLTGTPVSNGLLDLFGQFLILDDGAALGKYITKYRQEYFEQGYDGFSWLPRPGAKERIEKRVEPYVYRAQGYLDLPKFVNDTRRVELTPKARKLYQKLKKDLIADMEGDELIASNAAVLVGKLKQMANGRVYDADRNIIEIHEAKKEALVELMEELGDEQLLIAYEYNHDLDQLREVFGSDLPYLGAGVNERTAMDYVDRWNSRDIQVLAAHPASAGHGLNLQKGGAHHVLWFGPTVDLDHYIQFIDRLLRQGNKASHVVVHTFVATGTVDESVIVSRTEKDGLQSSVLKALTAEFGDDTPVKEENITYEDVLMTNLNFKNDADQNAAPTGGNPFATQPASHAPQGAANPFAAQPAPQAAPPQPAPQAEAPANPFAAAGNSTPAPAVSQPAPAANPFAQAGQSNGAQAAEIEQTVAAPSVPQPDPASAPPNPFAGQAAAPAPVEQSVEAPVETPQAPAEAPAPEVVQKSEAGVVAPQAPVPDGTLVVPVNIMVPLAKLDKVLSAIGRAVK